MNGAHKVDVVTHTVRDGLWLVLVRFQAQCAICGEIGGREFSREDAEAIAARHVEIQGFERRR